MSEHWATADRGAWAQHEKHAFRIGYEVPDSVEFRARRDEFGDELANAMIDHALKHGKRNYYNIQVLTVAGWRNIQHPFSGGVMAVTPKMAGNRASCVTIFDWACDSVQMMRDLDALAKTLAREAVE